MTGYYYNRWSHWTEWEMIPYREAIERECDFDYLEFLGETFAEAYDAFKWELTKARNNWY